jgi:tRNA 2-selenouridine synthase
VYVESESRKVGDLRVPERLIERMRGSRCFRLEAPEPARVALLLEDYAHFVARPAALAEKLACLSALHGSQRIEGWIGLLERGEWEPLVGDLLASHYDPAYRRSLARNYAGAASATPVPVTDIRPEGFLAIAKALVAAHG